MSRTISISEASEMLHVTEKTIRNYIKRGFLTQSKWNGLVQVPEHQVVEINRKKNGIRKSDLSKSQADEIQVSKSELSQYMLRAGKLEAFEALVIQQQEEIRKLSERVIQLEASSASGWSEARSVQGRCEKLDNELSARKQTDQQLREELGWLRREKEKIEGAYSESLVREREMRGKIKELEDRLCAEAILGFGA